MHVRPTRARLFVVASALALSACSFLTDSPKATPDDTPSIEPSASTSASVSPSASPNPTPSASPSVTEGPIISEPAGEPVTPEIFLATVDEAGGVLRVVVMVPGVYEDGGDCTTTVKAGTVTVTKQNTGQSDVSSTACGQFVFSLADLPPGAAQVTAHYESSTHAGTSAPTTVTIP